MTAMYDSHVRPLLAASGLFTDGRSSTQCGPRASCPRNAFQIAVPGFSRHHVQLL